MAMESRVARWGALAIGRSRPVRIMAIINASPESFYGGSVAVGSDGVRAAAEQAAEQGADVLDIGAMSTAPYRQTLVSPAEEEDRMGEAVAAARSASGLPLSADTMRASVARVALDAGASVINDVSGFEEDPAMAALAAERGCGVVLMARENAERPRDERQPALLVAERLSQALARADKAGVERNRVVLDPGLGFFRNTARPWEEFDLEILRHLETLEVDGHPLLVSASRKSFLKPLLGREKAEDRLAGSLAAAAWCALHGASMLRTHDVAATRDAVRLIEMLR
ncbi:MAG: dihydropteroate synthase [Candidatus Sumerlaeota bacterium]|nr:dihydropteroate synthase [Candidatus Sumerlaeota bacterium]